MRSFPPAERSAVRFFLTDIDDTMTEGGRLPQASYAALWSLHDGGIHVIPVTGRPAGWCDLICRQWPVSAVIGENGAFAFYLEEGWLRTLYHPQAPEPSANRERLLEIAEEVYRTVPGTRPAKDQFSRLFDVAVDFREEPPLLDYAEARRVRDIFASHGAHAKISSIHVNAWFGDYDKRSMAAFLLEHRFGLRVADPTENRQVVFCGDSPNDEPMFAAFANSIAVGNIEPFAAGMTSLPRYVSRGSHAAGFAEIVSLMLDR